MTTDSLNVGAPRDPAWTSDELILICEALRLNDWKPIRVGDPQATELSAMLQRLPIHPPEVRTPKFRSPSSVQRKGFDLLTQLPGYPGKPTKGGRLDREVLAEFTQNPELMTKTAGALRHLRDKDLARLLPEIDNEDGDDDRLEGRLLLRLHRVYERSRSLRLKRISAAVHSGEGLACQACGFDFEGAYGKLGEGYIQVHHLVPLHQSGPVSNGTTDLALLCANCHVMAHRAQPWPTIERLRDLRSSGRFTESIE